MKTFVLTVSRVFPKTHKQKGKQTYFPQKIDQIGMVESLKLFQPEKIHTIRSNYDLWAKRIEQVQKGEAILSVRYWIGQPYNSKQFEIRQFDKDSGVGIQIISDFGKITAIVRNTFDDEKAPIIRLEELAKGDGLSFEDFKEWFKKYDLSIPMAVIHFTDFRY